MRINCGAIHDPYRMNFCKTGLVAFLLLMSTGASAQKNFVEGYVVDNAGDTLRGLIDDKNWLNNPREVRFQKNQEAPAIVYTPADIRSFYVNSREHYRSKAVMYDASPHKLPDLGTSPDPVWQKDTLFLKVEAEGVVSLYYLRESTEREHFFLEKNGAGAEDLLNVRYISSGEGVKQALASQQYKSQLKNYLGDCNALKGKLYDVNYELEAIRNVVRQYNRCSGGAEATVVRPSAGERNRSIEWGLVAGVHLTQLRFSSEGRSYEKLTKGPYRGALNGVGGISLDFIIPRRHRQFIFRSELVYKPYHVTKLVERTGLVDRRYVKEDTYFRMGYVQGNLMFRYHRATFAKVRPFVQGGFLLGRSIKASSLTTTEAVFTSGATYYNQAPALEGLGRFNFGIVGGGGVTAGNFGLEARYERAAGPSNHPGLSSSTQSVYLLASYTLR